ncbi:DUF937 domain-containing protein [Mycolicibacterium confluentis]|uniref:Uncharacterized protein n=1 Tax=Mycolicibacterium confluentis TaxID=28047 RepID=A0A7I7XU51_9MYCO|nr:DUF937 domain-containing protein [Mycolicibacterium confluentis]MCV7320824.1 DUF937 domain-containing protein [Mycolicibacterium confluentis]ORV27125.1 hypothetical protein AWB99_20415 [Mycolicibacterium confluentis]BBZ32775.1 hypothetical protein MCNF_13800 [Mycolicibacterium confluentis]
MAGLDDLIAQIPVQDIASKLGADQGEVSAAIQQLVPALVGGLQVNAQNDDQLAGKIASSAEQHAGLLDGGVTVDDVDENDGDKIVANIFGGNDSTAVASALAGQAPGGSGLVQKLLPILAPIVLAYIGQQFSKNNAPAQEQAAQSGGGGIGDILGSILGGATGGGGGNNALGSILGSVLGGGGGNSNPIGEILGGLLGGKR